MYKTCVNTSRSSATVSSFVTCRNFESVQSTWFEPLSLEFASICVNSYFNCFYIRSTVSYKILGSTFYWVPLYSDRASGLQRNRDKWRCRGNCVKLIKIIVYFLKYIYCTYNNLGQRYLVSPFCYRLNKIINCVLFLNNSILNLRNIT